MSELFGNDDIRKKRLKEIVKSLHEGSDIKAVQKQFADLIKNVSPEEIAQMEQALIAEGVPAEHVQRLCDVHVQVFEKTLKRQKKMKALPGHPVHTYLEENRALKNILKNVKSLIRKAAKGQKRDEFERELNRLKEVEIHYRRKENQLFPFLEMVNFTGPSKVMWGKHDEIRSLIKDFESAFQKGSRSQLRAKGRVLLRAMRRMIFMEEKILLPTALKKLSDNHWTEIRKGEAEIGYAWVKPGNLWDPSIVSPKKGLKIQKDQKAAEAMAQGTKAGEEPLSDIALDIGRLSTEQINMMLKSLPVDITFVDENDRVRYYSQGEERIFPRSPGVIGRKVQNCHPPKSLHAV